MAGKKRKLTCIWLETNQDLSSRKQRFEAMAIIQTYHHLQLHWIDPSVDRLVHPCKISQALPPYPPPSLNLNYPSWNLSRPKSNIKWKKVNQRPNKVKLKSTKYKQQKNNNFHAHHALSGLVKHTQRLKVGGGGTWVWVQIGIIYYLATKMISYKKIYNNNNFHEQR